MSKKVLGTVSEDNYTFVKEVIGFENWDAKLNKFIDELRAKGANNDRNTNNK